MSQAPNNGSAQRSSVSESVAPLCGAPVPTNEDVRLEALHGLHILDTPPDERFDRIVRLASRRFDIPVCRVTFVDTDRVWFKARLGMNAEQAPRSIAICSHTIMYDSVFAVPDLAVDPRFADSPQVASGPRFRFYAGAPIILSDGVRVGALCLMDHRPRPDFTEEYAAELADLAEIVVHELELHRQIAERDNRLHTAEKRLAAAKRAKQRFLSIVSHELRTPLNAIDGFAQVLTALAEDGSEANEYAKQIVDASRRLERLIARVLMIADGEAGELRLAEAEVAIEPLVRQSVKAALAAAFKSDRDVAVVVTPDAPVRVVIDDVQVTEMVHQLVANALTNSGAQAAVSVTLDRDRWGGLSIAVRDRGPGIDPDRIEELMTAFAQGDDALNRSSSGLGLGLPITKALAELHGGRLIVEPNPDGGTCAEVVFPAHRNRKAAA